MDAAGDCEHSTLDNDLKEKVSKSICMFYLNVVGLFFNCVTILSCIVIINRTASG